MQKDLFKEKLYRDFQQDLYRVLNITLQGYVAVHASHGENPILRFEELYRDRGASAMRAEMQSSILFMRVARDETNLGRTMDWAEITELGRKLRLQTR